MSIRRKSCDPCFAARRKCDLRYPVCQRCERNSKTCHYRYPPQLPMRDDAVDVDDATDIGFGAGTATPQLVSYPGQLNNLNAHNMQFQQLDGNFTLQWAELGRSGIPNMTGNLGDLPPIKGCTPTWTWVFEQIRNFPLAFARQAETVFIHKALYGDSFPKPLRMAFGICAACASINDRNRSVLFQSLDAEIRELLSSAPRSTLLEDVARLQAAVLYQIIRLFYGGLEQRIVAERQEFLIRSYGLTLLLRADAELQTAQQTWETWLLAESIRRTVLISFKLYTIYSNYTYGICAEAAAIGILPVSTQPGLWHSRGAYLRCLAQEKTTTYGDFTSGWLAAPRKKVELYEKFLLVGCKEIESDQIEALMGL
ncbi:hypothetical protein N431DRAFT_429024 [Stipitochalara longipes BDJ]|nr:hypothetical protein N431DRAFT_429024 [Stipitochalara longipes BDJ]